ncbi:MAG: flagellar hook-basal body complex protein FliE [Deferribacteraceae bacterium]|jgi:flagellar hook-basal body complex protein FliE|nr:flagellar hook-basal body complex protein FliE [Deferribacteraceae bacterium]
MSDFTRSDFTRIDALHPKDISVGRSLEKEKLADKLSKGEAGFSEMLKGALNSVNDAQFEADEAVKQVLSGQSANIHETMIALQKADVSLKLMLEVRNKILEAYQEVMRTQM